MPHPTSACATSILSSNMALPAMVTDAAKLKADPSFFAHVILLPLQRTSTMLLIPDVLNAPLPIETYV